MVYLQANFFENWYYPMPEKGFSFFEIQTPLEKCNPPQTKRSPITWGVNPSTWWGRSYGRLSLPNISATRKVRENTKSIYL